MFTIFYLISGFWGFAERWEIMDHGQVPLWTFPLYWSLERTGKTYRVTQQQWPQRRVFVGGQNPLWSQRTSLFFFWMSHTMYFSPWETTENCSDLLFTTSFEVFCGLEGIGLLCLWSQPSTFLFQGQAIGGYTSVIKNTYSACNDPHPTSPLEWLKVAKILNHVIQQATSHSHQLCTVGDLSVWQVPWNATRSETQKHNCEESRDWPRGIATFFLFALGFSQLPDQPPFPAMMGEMDHDSLLGDRAESVSMQRKWRCFFTLKNVLTIFGDWERRILWLWLHNQNCLHVVNHWKAILSGYCTSPSQTCILESTTPNVKVCIDSYHLHLMWFGHWWNGKRCCSCSKYWNSRVDPELTSDIEDYFESKCWTSAYIIHQQSIRSLDSSGPRCVRPFVHPIVAFSQRLWPPEAEKTVFWLQTEKEWFPFFTCSGP